MKRLIYLLLLLTVTVCQAQTTSRNFILSRTFKQTGAAVNNVSQVQIQVQYLDGLGRPLQTVDVGQSQSGKDLVRHQQYDGYGRATIQFLPYATGTNGDFQASSLAAGFYTGNSASLESTDLGRPFTETTFERSALNRPTAQLAPGNKSTGSSISYGSNGGTEVKRYDYSANANILSTVTANGNYPAGKLSRVQTTDENGKIHIEFTDMQGRVICKKEGSEALATYYVYDDFSQLRAVLQPKYEDEASTSNYAFLYQYDDRGRVTAKKVPGAGVVNMVYDNFDRLVLSQDANQLARGVWAFTKYDALNRPVITGELPSASTQGAWQTAFNASSAHHEDKTSSGIGYTLTNTLPNATQNIQETHVLNVSYFDDYSFPKPTSLNYVDTYTISARTTVKGQATGSRTKMLNAGAQWLVSAVYYDTEYRTIQTASELYDLGGAIQRVSNKYKYDLAAVIAEEKTEQLLPSSTNIHLKTFEYDHADRLLSVKEKVSIGSMPAKEVTTLGQRYNELGQILQKGQHSGDGVNFQRRTSYTHNIRGWLTDAKTSYWKRKSNPADSSFFTYKIAYANGVSYTNGNISEIQWSGKAQTSFTKGLSFSYDGVNRLTGSSGLYSYADTESGINYDKNGNLLSLNRAGFAVDNLTYQYDGTGNRMSGVTNIGANGKGVKNGVSGYAYDANGNMTGDGNRGATLSYNYLNLPTNVVVGGKTLTYDYDAAGTKHKYVADTLTLKYAGAFEYRQAGSANNFSRLSISDGQAVIRKDTLRFDYFVKDHLGNVRVVFDEQRRPLQQTDYYPNGLAVPRDGTLPENARNGFNRYLYNEKELQIGSGYLDYGARMYMPEIGRWGVVDPLSEVAEGLSPFMYGNGNPVLMIDPNGMLSTYNWDTGKYQDSHGGTVGFEEVKKEYGVEQNGRNTNCCPDSPNVKAAQAKNNNGVQGRLDAAGWKPGQTYPAIDGIETDLSIESVAIPLAKPVEWLAKPLLGLIRAQWLASMAGKSAAKGGGSLVNLTEETFSQALFNGAENVGGYSIYGTKGLVGSTFNRNIFLLEASGGKSLSGFRSFVRSLEAEALGTGANKISIYGSSVINKGFLNPNIATRFGYSFEQSGSGVFLQKVLK